MMDDRFRHDAAEAGHALAEPGGHAPAMKRKVRAAGASRHPKSPPVPRLF
jgi:hypothetical protein